MSSSTEFDLIVIGAGAAGSTAATIAADAGHRVALIERDRLGGTCLNYGCDPTKTMLRAAHLLAHARAGERHGLQIPQAEVEWQGVLARVARVQERIRGGSPEEARAKLAAREHLTLIMGEARCLSPHEVAVGAQRLRAGRLLIATGGAAAVPPITGLREAGFITNEEAVTLPRLPRRLVIIGGGPIGVEFAQLFHRFGVAVTVLEQGPALLGKDDREMAERLCGLLGESGIRMETSVEVRAVAQDREGKRLRVRCGEQAEETIVADEILLATGRRPVYGALDLAAAGVETDDDGIVVDKTLRTSVDHIWAAGDVTGDYPFTHVAAEQGKLAAQNAFAPIPRAFDDRVIPWATYTDPTLAHVGRTEAQLREAGVPYRVGRLDLAELDRAIIEGETEGAVKLLVGENDALLGAHILAPNAGDLLAPVVVAMRAGLPATALADALLPYPTFAEALRWAAARALEA